MKSLWNGSLNFIQLKIAIKIYHVVEEADIGFRLLHGDCKTPINMKKWCEHCKTELKEEDLIKGYDIDKQNFILFTKEELESVSENPNKTIHISDCVSINAISLIVNKGDFFYIGAEKGFERACMLLSESLRKTNSCLVGKWVHHNKEHDIIIVPYAKQLMISVLRYGEEIVSTNELWSIVERDIPTDEEVQLGIELVKRVSKRKFNLPYTSSYNQKFKDLMNSKVNEMIKSSLEETEGKEGKGKNLVEELKQSIDSVKNEKDVEGDKQ